MNYRFSRMFRIICSIVLFFFLWTFELSGIAYAIKNDWQSAVNQTSKTKTEQMFGKDIEGLENILKDTTTDIDTKKRKLKAKKADRGR